MRRGIRFLMTALCVGLLGLGLHVLEPGASGQDKKAQKFMGVDKCKKCHDSKAKGDQHGQWEGTHHAKAYKTLGGDEAKKIAKEKGIDDPQKSEACLKCHVTAFGAPKEALYKKFDPAHGVQCEACHGPAEKHTKNRMADEDEDEKSLHEKAKKEMPLPTKDLCKRCHNTESPTVERSEFWNKEKKEFDVEKAWKKILHPNPKWTKH